MGTFIGHIVPGLALTLLGLWHAINTVKSYCFKGSANFTVKFWYPLYGPFSRLKHLELLLIPSFSILAILFQLLDYPSFRFAFKLDNFEHATIFLHVAVFAGFTLCAELTHSSNILLGVTGILTASIFGQELFLLHFHSADHVGLEGHYHWLLQLIVFVSLVAALTATVLPTCFPAALVLSASVVLQGFWFMNMGFMLWLPQFVPEGCVLQLSANGNSDMRGAVACGSIEAYSRARALANLQFSWIISTCLLSIGCISLKLAREYNLRGQSVAYEKLQTRHTEVSIATDSFKQASP